MSTIASIKTEEDICTMVQMLMEVKHEPLENNITANIEENLIYGLTMEDIASVKVRCQMCQHMSIYVTPVLNMFIFFSFKERAVQWNQVSVLSADGNAKFKDVLLVHKCFDMRNVKSTVNL